MNAPQKQLEATEDKGTDLLPFAYSHHHPARAAFSRSSTYLAIHQYSGWPKKRIPLCILDPPLVSFLLS